MNVPRANHVHLNSVLLVVNSSSGRVGARHAGCSMRGVLEMLHEAAVGVALLDVARTAGVNFTENLAQALHKHDALILAGGDGTLHHALPALLRTPRPIYHLPLGTENLFAREHAMTCEARDLLKTIRRGLVRTLDLGVLDVHGRERPFALMCSVGPDASIVGRLAHARRGPITHLSYARHIFDELLSPSLHTLTIRCEGRAIVRRERGMLIIANSERYALGINPAAGARPDDGVLDLVFMPAQGAWTALARFAESWLRTPHSLPGLIRASGREIEVHASDGPLRAQVDGEWLADCGSRLRAGILPGVLPVLVVP